jgi:hypothetical protein
VSLTGTAILALLMQASPPPQDSNAVVAIYADQGNGVALQGTGFFVDRDGGILTAYHVIQGARSLMVYHKGVNYRAVTIEGIAPRYDLARLRLDRPPANHHVLPLAGTSVEAVADERLRLIGWPRNQDNSTLRGYLTTGRPSESFALSNQEGKRVFRHNIDILTVDITTEPGISGAPLMSSIGVLGVLSGSYNTGGGIAWVIPVAHIRRLQRLSPPRFASQMTWPTFDLIYPDRSAGLRAAYSYNAEAALIFVNATELVASVRAAIGEMTDSVRNLLRVARLIAEVDSVLLRGQSDSSDWVAAVGSRESLLEQLNTSRAVIDAILYGETEAMEEFATVFDELTDHAERAAAAAEEMEDSSAARLRAGLARIGAAEERGEGLAEFLDEQEERVSDIEQGLSSAQRTPVVPESAVRPEILRVELAWLDALREYYHAVLEGGILIEVEAILDGFSQLHELYTFDRRLLDYGDGGP